MDLRISTSSFVFGWFLFKIKACAFTLKNVLIFLNYNYTSKGLCAFFKVHSRFSPVSPEHVSRMQSSVAVGVGGGGENKSEITRDRCVDRVHRKRRYLTYFYCILGGTVWCFLGIGWA